MEVFDTSSRKNRSPEEQAWRAKIRELLQESNISSMEDIQNLFKETIAEFMENGLEAELDEVSEDTLKNLLSVDVEVWKKEADDIAAFFEQVGEGKLPKELAENLEILKKNLGE